jgi:hypothetical protein
MSESIEALLDLDDAVVQARWERLEAWICNRFGRENTSVEAILFLVGIQSKGRGYEPQLEKEAKQTLIMEGTYHVFETIGLYERVGMEAGGFWVWERTTPLPDLDVDQQEKLLRIALLRYFENAVGDF